MDRRQFLGTAGAGALLSVGGYEVVTEPKSLSNPTVEREADGETHLIFRPGEEPLATVVVQPDTHVDDEAPIPVDVSIEHRDGTTVTGLRLDLRAPPGGAAVPAQVALIAPQWKPHPEVELHTDTEDGSTVLDIPDTNGQGEGTLTLQFLVDPVAVDPEELRVDVAVDLATGGLLDDGYGLSGAAHVPLP